MGAALGSFTISGDFVLGLLAFIIQGAALYGAVMWRTGKYETSLSAIQAKVNEYAGLAEIVTRLDTTMKRAVTDIEDIMQRFGGVPQQPFQQQSMLAGIPADVLAQIIFNMARKT